jgi:hypothetical protein
MTGAARAALDELPRITAYLNPGRQRGAPMSANERPDYSSLLGFVVPQERVDPHVRVVSTSTGPDLREIAEIVRDKSADKVPESTVIPSNK